jgi:phage RecT family recombinase
MSEERTITYDIQTIGIRDEKDLKQILAANYSKTLENYLGSPERARKFMSSVMTDVQRNPKLLKSTPVSLFNAYLTMASCGFMPSAVSGEAYVLPYDNSKNVDGKWIKVTEAQFQIGYQGLVTLFYRAGVTRINGVIVHEKDVAEMVNGVMMHKVPLTLSKEERGAPIGAYVTVTFRGQDNTLYMNGKDIIAHATKFSKTYKPDDEKIWKHSPWNPANDPELSMWKKTVLKQHAKLLPKNESINIAIAADNADSVMYDRIEAAKADQKKLSMGALLSENDNGNKENKDDGDYSQDADVQGTEGYEEQPPD